MDRVTGTKLGQYLLVAVSAAAMWASFPEINLWFLAPVSLALLVAAVDSVGIRRGSWYAALWAMLFFIPHISWMNVATEGVFLAWITLAAAQAFFLAWWGGFFAATRVWAWARTWWGEVLVATVLWVGIEQLRSRVPFGGFPWGKVAYSQVGAPLLSLAPLGGEVLVTGVCMAVAVLLRRALSGRSRRPRRLIMAGSAVAVYLLPGFITLPTGAQAGTVNIAAVQGNVEIPMFETYGILGKVTDNHLQETLRLLADGAQPDVIFWGEDSIDRDPNTNATTAAMIQEVLDTGQVPLVAGYQEYAGDIRYNWIGVWYPQTGQSEMRYGKQHPVPWGEFVPWRSFSQLLAVEAAQVSVDMVSVDNPGYLPVTLNDGRVLPLAIGICFEVADEQIISEGVRLGGQMIIIPTNNSHFRYSAESTQQLQMLQFRAAEFSRAGAQVSTNGVSAIIAADGSIEQITDKQVAAHLLAEIPLRTTMTPAASAGQFPALLAIAVTLGGGATAVIMSYLSMRRSKHAQ